VGAFVPSSWSVALLFGLAVSVAHATEAPVEPETQSKPNAPPRFDGLTKIEPSGDFEFNQGESVLKAFAPPKADVTKPAGACFCEIRAASPKRVRRPDGPSSCRS
jgi:hypothetical protein